MGTITVCSRCRLPIAAAEVRAEVRVDAAADPRRPVRLCEACTRGLDWFLASVPELSGLEVNEPTGAPAR